jgi:hypothetical protein
MNKKLLALAVAVCVLAPMTLSARAFDFNLGATAQYQKDVISEPVEIDDLIDINNYRFGAEARLNFILLEVSETALLGSTDFNGADAIEFTNHLAAGIYTDVADVVRLGLLAGPEFEMKITEDGIKNGDGTEFEFLDLVMESNFTYKAHADFLLGKALTLSATYTLPTSFNLNNPELDKLIPGSDDWASGRFGISLLLF